MERVLRRGLLAAGLAAPGLARAQAFPDRPVHLVIPYSAGGGTDVVGRELARHLAEALGQPVVVENRSGGNTGIAAEYVARARPDGHTLYFAGGSSLVVPPLVSRRFPVRATDFAPVSLVLKQAYGLGITPSLAPDLAALVALMRAQPGHFGFGHTGTGSVGHLIGERLMAATGTSMISVPYRGFAQTVVDVMSGRLAMTFEAVNNFLPFTREQKVRLIAVSSDQRLRQLPEVPTFVEAGYRDMVVESWLAVWAPTGTPAEVVARLNGAVVRAVQQPGFRALTERQIQRIETTTPEGLAELAARDLAAWQRVIAPLKLEID